ncbi:hypothetical protein JCM19046_1666 [Bacillus sp. JCM 19046]|nr:hypothetical protein JCM19045_249 [Bacillus sp. JCM 19045]GAF17172.1 hypothetical protein JCM19046_1666 [Bacillus sp. JCM 19046]
MKKGVLISILIICFIVGGFFVIRAMNQAEDVALSDDFTSRFLDEDVETDEGFHYFESGNGKFSMWFPENFKVNDRGAQYVSKEHYESFIANSNANNQLKESMVVFYEGERAVQDIDFALTDLLSDSSFENEYLECANEKMVFYHGSSYAEVNGTDVTNYSPKSNTPNSYFALVTNTTKERYFTIRFNGVCENGEDCSEEYKGMEETFSTILKSIKFE